MSSIEGLGEEAASRGDEIQHISSYDSAARRFFPLIPSLYLPVIPNVSEESPRKGLIIHNLHVINSEARNFMEFGRFFKKAY
jgi:hypothetical protein